MIYYILLFMLIIFSFNKFVMNKHPMRLVLWLMFSFLGNAFLFFLASYDFFGASTILLYVTAVVTLFVFVIFLVTKPTDSFLAEYKQGSGLFYIALGFVIPCIILLIAAILNFEHIIDLKEFIDNTKVFTENLPWSLTIINLYNKNWIFLLGWALLSVAVLLIIILKNETKK